MSLSDFGGSWLFAWVLLPCWQHLANIASRILNCTRTASPILLQNASHKFLSARSVHSICICSATCGTLQHRAAGELLFAIKQLHRTKQTSLTQTTVRCSANCGITPQGSEHSSCCCCCRSCCHCVYMCWCWVLGASSVAGGGGGGA